MRLFVAVEVPEEIRRGIFRIGNALEGKDLKMFSQGNMHITLKFLGEVKDGKELEWVKEQLKGVKFTPFKVGVGGVGAFPNAKDAKVIWAGVGEGKRELAELAEEVGGALSPKFGEEDRGFAAHITLARIKERMDARGFLNKHANEGFGEFTVGEFLLVKSVLKESGAEYSVMGTFGAKATKE